MTWEEAFQVIEPIPTDDYNGGRWASIRKSKCKAMFELAQEADDGVILELGSWRGLVTVTLALGAHVPVHTIDFYHGIKGCQGEQYVPEDKKIFDANIARAGVTVTQHVGDLFEIVQTWTEPIALLVWDVWDEILEAALKAWQPHVRQGGIFSAKRSGNITRATFYSFDGWKPYREYEDSDVWTLQKM